MNTPDNVHVDTQKELPFLVRYGLVVLAGVVACVIIVPGHGLGVIGSVLCFPLGLLRWVNLHKDQSGASICIAWGIYGGLVCAAIQVRRLRPWLFIYVCLLVLVVVGAAGCRLILSEAQHQNYGF